MDIKAKLKPKPKMSSGKLISFLIQKYDAMRNDLAPVIATLRSNVKRNCNSTKQSDMVERVEQSLQQFSECLTDIKNNPPVPTMSVSDASHLPRTVALESGFGMQVDFGWKKWMNPKNVEPIPDYHRDYIKLMKDVFQQQFLKSGQEACFRVQLNALLGALVSKVNNTKPPGTRSLQISTEQTMSYYPFSYDCEDFQLQGQADYALWYGRKRDIDTNLVILEAKGGESPVGSTQLVLYMAMVHKKRCEMGKQNRIVYGILAQPLQFNFFQIDNAGVCSSHCIQSRSFDGYVPLLTSIIMDAAALSPPSSEEADTATAMDPTAMDPTAMDEISD